MNLSGCMRFCGCLVAVAAALAFTLPAFALERVVASPYTGSSNEKLELRLPTCAANQVLTSLGSNTFTCLDALGTNVNGGDGVITLPTCGADDVLAVSGKAFVCAKAVKSAPSCNKGYALVGNGAQTLTCVKVNDDPPACKAGQALTTSTGSFVCVDMPVQKKVPSCVAGQVLTAENGEFACKTISATNCDGRVIQNWGGYSYCSNITCADNQVLTLRDGFMQCRVPPSSAAIDVVVVRQKGGDRAETPACPGGYRPVTVTYWDVYGGNVWAGWGNIYNQVYRRTGAGLRPTGELYTWETGVSYRVDGQLNSNEGNHTTIYGLTSEGVPQTNIICFRAG